MTAKELKKIALEKAHPAIDAEYAKIQDLITQEAKKGLFEYVPQEPLSKIMKEKLLGDGFYLYSKPEDNGRTRINWE